MRFKTLMLGVFLTALAVVSPAFGQDVCADIEANQALYKEYTDHYKGDVTRANMAAKERAVAAAKEYTEKYAACPDFKAQVDYLKSNSPKLAEKIVVAKKEFAAADRIARFNKAVPAGKADEIFASGKDVLKDQPELLDVIIVLAGVGLDEIAVNKNNTFNNEAASYAKTAISKIEGSGKSTKYGAYDYEYKTRENALGWMNYTIGYIMFYGQKNEEAGLSYFYKATQHDSDAKERYFIYDLIGDFYRNKAVSLGNEIIEILKTTENKENFETKSKYALQKGYAERAIDAYARAYEIGKSAKPAASKEYLSDLKETLETFYKFRFVTETNPSADIDAEVMSYVASVKNKPFPSPTSEVKPVDPPTDEEATPDASTATPNKAPAKSPAAPMNGDKGKSEADKNNNKPKKQ